MERNAQFSHKTSKMEGGGLAGSIKKATQRHSAGSEALRMDW